jgi:hypothetical protein
MAWFDVILDRTGAIGSLIGRQMFIQNRNVQVEREKSNLTKANAARVEQNLNITFPPVKETKILLDNGGVIWFDVATEVNHEWPSTVTEFPVEDGASVSDHIVNGNVTFNVTGVFSDYRLTKPDAEGNPTLPEQPTQVEVYQALIGLRENRESFSLLTPLSTYSNVVLKNLGMPRDMGDALSVKMEFVQIRRAVSGITTVSLIEKPKTVNSKSAKNPDKVSQEKLAETKDKGNVAPPPVDDRSNPKKLLNSFTGG